MRNPCHHLRGPLVAAAAILLVACHRAPVTTAPAPVPFTLTPVELPPPVGASSPAAVAAARVDSVQHPYTLADIRFMSSMIGHHAQAIQMSNLAPARGAGAQVLRLAGRVINAQLDEITIMQTWLADRLQPVPDARPATGEHAAHASHALMAGMLTPAQMTELEGARGEQFDRLFLRFMIQHHQGAVSMVTELLGSQGAAQNETVFKFASDVNVDQTTEISRMQLMLAELLIKAPVTR